MGQFEKAVSIKTIIEWMNSNKLLIPAFQRDYVWHYTQVENLFDSIMRGYPINSMLFWEVSGKARTSYKFYKFLEDYVEYHHYYNEPFNGCETRDSFLAVLDGQQRLSSLYLGLCGTYAYHTKYQSWEECEKSFPTRRLYLNLSHTVDEGKEGDEEKKYKFTFLTKQQTNNFNDHIVINGENWFRVGACIGIQSVESYAEDHILSEAEAKMLKLLQEQICIAGNINYYRENTVSADQAVNIFIRINSGGTYLSMSEILMSMLRAGWQSNARDAVKKLTDKVATKDFYIGHEYIIKALLYLESENIKNLIQNFNNDFIGRTEQNWNRISQCIISLFDLLLTYNLSNSTLLSYNATLPILYYLYHHADDPSKFVTSRKYAQERNNIRTWLFKTLLLKSFSTSSDTMLQKARKPMKDNLLSSFPSSLISEALEQRSVVAPEQIEELLNVQKEDRRAYLILSLLLPEYIRYDVDKDHLHPLSYFNECNKLSKGKVTYEQYNSIVNLQLLPKSDNRSKNATPLKDWIKEYQKIDRRIYAASMIPKKIDLGLENFAKFYDKRRNLLSAKLLTILTT